jgi:predicted phage tail component-like protein
MGLAFKGEKRDYLIIERGRKRPVWSPVQRNMVAINGRAGVYHINTTTEMRKIDIPVHIKAKGMEDLQKIKEDLAAWLVTDEPEELIFDDEADRTYYAYVTGGLDLDESSWGAKGTITFICPDAYKYSNYEVVQNIPSSYESFSVENRGTAEAEPKFTFYIEKEITSLSLINDESFVMLGEPVNVDENKVVQSHEVVMEDNMSTTADWTSANTFTENGIVTGSMTTDGNKFSASDFGTGTEWHGPVLKKTLPETLQDFQTEFIVECKSLGNPSKVGRLECIMLDANNQTVCKLSLKDLFQGHAENQAEMRVGDISTGTRLINTGGYKKDDWDNFYGMLRFARVGNEWFAYIAPIKDGRHDTNKSRTESFTDHDEQYMNPVTQVMLHIGQKGTVPVPNMKIDKVKVFKRNNVSVTEIPIMAKPGDVIEVYHESGTILKNGEDFSESLDISSSDFFKLKPGLNKLAVYPSDVAQTELRFRERFL